MSSAEILVDAFERIRDLVHEVSRDLSEQQLTYRVDPDANTIAWLVWHLTRIQDDHLADAAGTEQVWTAEGWLERFGLPFDPEATGYGASAQEVAAVRVSRDLLTGYHDAVHSRTVAYVGDLTESDLTRIVDTSWDPPVSLAVRLVSVIGDDLQHVGQAAFVRGIVRR
ncbi:DUF664 domain-containing protein [Micromonospora sp. NPDC050417]|uniref:mycothiol transferase n=1 Tax=Micromonospora sp. NPDC050417 TaxID=3364280 RepID=UPI003796BBDE